VSKKTERRRISPVSRKCHLLHSLTRLRVVSNFGDGDCEAGKIHTRAREISIIFGAPFASRLLELSRARVYFARPTITIANIRDYSQSKSDEELTICILSFIFTHFVQFDFSFKPTMTNCKKYFASSKFWSRGGDGTYMFAFVNIAKRDRRYVQLF